MKSLRRLLATLVVTLATTPACRADDKMRESLWYPLQVGNTWTYRIGDKGFICKVVAHEKVGDVLCARVDMTPVGTSKPQTFEHLAVAEDGVYRHSINGTRLDKPVRILKLPPKKGDTWAIDAKGPGEALKGTVKAGEEAEVKVLAGTYKNVATTTCDDLDANGLHCAFTYYFAEGIGIIKQKVQIEKDMTVFELEKFEAGKK
jgi:hypothetical protein